MEVVDSMHAGQSWEGVSRMSENAGKHSECEVIRR